MLTVRSFDDFEEIHPADSFLEVDSYTSPDGYNDGEFQEETKKDLVVVLQQYFTFATMEDLLSLINDHFE
jgi:hypothetical protein